MEGVSCVFKLASCHTQPEMEGCQFILHTILQSFIHKKQKKSKTIICKIISQCTQGCRMDQFLQNGDLNLHNRRSSGKHHFATFSITREVASISSCPDIGSNLWQLGTYVDWSTIHYELEVTKNVEQPLREKIGSNWIFTQHYLAREMVALLRSMP